MVVLRTEFVPRQGDLALLALRCSLRLAAFAFISTMFEKLQCTKALPCLGLSLIEGVRQWGLDLPCCSALSHLRGAQCAGGVLGPSGRKFCYILDPKISFRKTQFQIFVYQIQV